MVALMVEGAWWGMTSSVRPNGERAGALRVLVIEDSQDDFDLIIRELTRGGYTPLAERVETAAQFEAALEREPWDLAVSDWCLPQFSAERALEILTARRLDVPLIIVSGSIDEEVAVQALRGGASDFLSKDKLARLLPAVKRELREAGRRRESRA